MNRESSREFFRKIRSALGHPPDVVRRNSEHDRKTVRFSDLSGVRPSARTRADTRMLLERFRQEAVFLHLRVLEADGFSRATEMIAELVRNQQPEWGESRRILMWKDEWLDRLHLSEQFRRMEIPVYSGDGATESRDEFREAAALSCIGITSADYAIADSATLVLMDGPGRPRMVSLMPSTHIAVIPLDRILASLAELVAILRPDPGNCDFRAIPDMTFISGPSKTADIEACMVHGAHGPREVYVIVLTDSNR